MSLKLTVILLEDVASLGRAGDIVTVSSGYARNSLFPEGKAALADEPVRARAQKRQAQQKASTAADLQKLQALAEKLEGTELALSARRKEEAGDEIFGSFTARQIVEELNRAASLSLKAKDIKLPKPLTRLGSQDITIQLSPDVETKIRVTITPNEEN